MHRVSAVDSSLLTSTDRGSASSDLLLHHPVTYPIKPRDHPFTLRCFTARGNQRMEAGSEVLILDSSEPFPPTTETSQPLGRYLPR